MAKLEWGSDDMAIFFTADTHFFHRRIVDYCDRPFRTLDGHPDVKAMNEALIEQWNAAVRPQDVVYHLGDFGFGSPDKLHEVRRVLNGKMILIRGNHDHKIDKWILANDEVHKSLMVGKVWLAHVPPINEVPKNNYGLKFEEVPGEAHMLVCGHVHNLWDYRVYAAHGQARAIANVGVDIYKYKPIPMESIPGLEECWKG